jgi:hypothetical protein
MYTILSHFVFSRHFFTLRNTHIVKWFRFTSRALQLTGACADLRFVPCSVFQSAKYFSLYVIVAYYTDFAPKHGTPLTSHQNMARHWPYTKAWHTTDLAPKYGRQLTLHQSMARHWLYTKAWHVVDFTSKHGTPLTLHQSMSRHWP